MAIKEPTWIYKSKGDKQTASEMNELAQAVIINATELSNTKYDVADLINNATGLDNRITTIEESGPINQADNDDLENAIINGAPVIREKTNKTYNPEIYSGMGRVILRKNMVNGVNVLTQEMINQANTIYEIRYDFDLNGAEITIPIECVLQFEGGSIDNGVLVGVGSYLYGTINVLPNINLLGTFKNEYLDISWFGAKGDGITDNINYIQHTIDSCIYTNIKTVTGPAGKYNISKPINFNTTRAGITLKYSSVSTKWGGEYKGFEIIGNTGTSIIEMIGSYQSSIQNIKITSGDTNPSTIGIVMGRGTQYPGVLHTIIKDILIDMGSNNTVNNTIGTIGIYMVSNEESSYIDCDVWADAPIILEPTNSVYISPVDSGGVPIQESDVNKGKTFKYIEFYKDDTLIVNPVSNTIFNFIRGRYISYGNSAPIFTIGPSSQVSIKDSFLQRADSISSSEGYGYAFHLSEYRNSEIKNITIENSRAAIVSTGSLNSNDISISMNVLGNLDVALLTLIEPEESIRYINNSKIKIIDTLTYHSDRGVIPISYIRNIIAVYPLFYFKSSIFESNTYYGNLSKDVSWLFRNNSTLILEDYTLNFNDNKQSTNIGKMLSPLNAQDLIKIFGGKYYHVPRTGTDFNITVKGAISISGPSYGSYTNSSINFELSIIIGIYGNSTIPNSVIKDCTVYIKSSKSTYFWEAMSSVDCKVDIDVNNSEFNVFIKAIRGPRTLGEVPDIVGQPLKFIGDVIIESSPTHYPVHLTFNEAIASDNISTVSNTFGLISGPVYTTAYDKVNEWRHYDGTLISKVTII